MDQNKISAVAEEILESHSLDFYNIKFDKWLIDPMLKNI